MLYLEDDSRSLWPEVVRVLAALEPLDMVLCAYAGDAFDSAVGPFEPLDGPTTMDGVTESDGEPVQQSRRVTVDESLLALLEAHLPELEEWGDSLVVGRPGHREWVAASIPHEGMILVQPEYGSALAAAGYRPGDDAPDWW